MAAREGMILTSKHLENHVIFEFDVSNMIYSIDFINQFVEDELVISFIWFMGSQFATFQTHHCKHTANEITHFSTSKGLHDFIFFFRVVVLGLLVNMLRVNLFILNV